MKLTHTTLLGGLTALAAVALAQEPSRTTQPLAPAAQDRQGAVPVRPFLDRPAPSLDVEVELRRRLALRDLDAREAAYDEAAQKAASDPETRRALETIAADETDPDVAFLARLALRESDRHRSGPRRLQPIDPRGPLGPQIDMLFGGSSFFGPPSGVGSGMGADPFEEIRERMREARRDAARRFRAQGSRTFSTGSSSSLSIQTTPNGVRVEVVEDDGSGPVTNVYEAPTLDALLELHPELRSRIGR